MSLGIPQTWRLTAASWSYPALLGVVIALAASLILQFPPVWAFLIILGLAVLVGSLLSQDAKNYWLALFALTLPLEIKKMLIGSEGVRELASLYAAPLGELPGPVLYLSDLPFLVLLGYWLWELACKKQKIVFPRSNWLAVGFLFWCGFSLINAHAFSYGFYDLLRTLKFYILFLYISNNVRSLPTLRILVTSLLLGMILQGVLCAYQYKTQNVSHIFGNLFGQQDLYNEESIKKFEPFFNISEGAETKRASGTVGPINAQAQYFEFILPMAFLLALSPAGFWRRVLVLTVLAFGLVGIIVTFSRGGVVGLAGGIALVVLLAGWLQLISPRKFLALALLGVCLLMAAAPLAYKYLLTRPEAYTARVHLANVGMEMIKAHPVLGVGLNNHLVVKPQFDSEQYAFPMPTHNQYILMASEVGIPGLLFFLGFLFMTAVTAFRATRSKDLYVALVALGIIGSLTAISIHNFTDHLSYHTNLTFIWLYAGLAAALPNLGRQTWAEPSRSR